MQPVVSAQSDRVCRQLALLFGIVGAVAAAIVVLLFCLLRGPQSVRAAWAGLWAVGAQAARARGSAVQATACRQARTYRLILAL